jgi:hypothetical protein
VSPGCSSQSTGGSLGQQKPRFQQSNTSGVTKPLNEQNAISFPVKQRPAPRRLIAFVVFSLIGEVVPIISQ